MRPNILPALSVAAAALAFSACARVQSQAQPPAQQPTLAQQGAARATRGRVTDHVVVISVDGLRPDAITKYKPPTLTRLMREGRYSLSAQTISISSTLPSHTSMLTGVDSDQHGITWNSDKTGRFGYVKVPTIFGLAHSAGFSTAAFFSKTKFHHLEVPATLDHSRSPKRGILPWSSARTVGYVESYLKTSAPNLLFVHLAEADFAGHNFGWMSHVYGMAIRETDVAIARVLAAADERFGRGRYSVILTADHGGHGKRHGSTDPRDTTIPWIVWGAGVQQQADTLSGIRTMDTAATALWMLGLQTPADWVGKAVSSAFTANVAGK